MRRFIGPLGQSVLTSNTLARENLEPEDSVFSQPQLYFEFIPYYQNLISVFREIYESNAARVVVAPSFTPECALAISESHDAPKILLLKPEKQIRLFEVLAKLRSGEIRATDLKGRSRNDEQIAELEAVLPPRVEDVRVSRCEFSIDPLTAETLQALWREMLRRTQYPERGSIRLDGTCYHFSIDFNTQTLAGQTHSPDAASRPGKLVEIVDLLEEACETKNINNVKRAELIARELLDALDPMNH